MQKKNLNILSKNLEKQFSDLGFDLSKICDSVLKVKNAAIICDQHDCRQMPINGEIVLFMFNASNAWNPENCKISYINVRVATNSAVHYHYDISYEKDYFLEKGPLPTKSQMLEEIKEALSNSDLKSEFEKLGFDFSEIESSVEGATEKLSGLFFFRSMKVVSPVGDKLVIRFDVENFLNGRHARIKKITGSVYNMNDIVRPIVRKEYNEENGQLPKKEDIIDEMTKLLRIQLVQEKFDLNNNKNNQTLNPPSTQLKARI